MNIGQVSGQYVRHLKLSSTVDDINGFFNGQVTPHRHLSTKLDSSGNEQERNTSISLERLDTTSMGELFSEWTINSLEEKGATFLCGP